MVEFIKMFPSTVESTPGHFLTRPHRRQGSHLLFQLTIPAGSPQPASQPLSCSHSGPGTPLVPPPYTSILAPGSARLSPPCVRHSHSVMSPSPPALSYAPWPSPVPPGSFCLLCEQSVSRSLLVLERSLPSLHYQQNTVAGT